MASGWPPAFSFICHQSEGLRKAIIEVSRLRLHLRVRLRLLLLLLLPPRPLSDYYHYYYYYYCDHYYNYYRYCHHRCPYHYYHVCYGERWLGLGGGWGRVQARGQQAASVQAKPLRTFLLLAACRRPTEFLQNVLFQWWALEGRWMLCGRDCFRSGLRNVSVSPPQSMRRACVVRLNHLFPQLMS